jgi:hypothetical protein
MCIIFLFYIAEYNICVCIYCFMSTPRDMSTPQFYGDGRGGECHGECVWRPKRFSWIMLSLRQQVMAEVVLDAINSLLNKLLYEHGLRSSSL